VAREAADLWAREAREAGRGRFRVALSGGRTPEALFRLLDVDLPWDRTDMFWVDERYVPHGHAESNYRLAKELLLDHVPVPRENIHPIPTSSGDPARDAADYEAILRRAFPGQAWPRFDLVLLGLGEDGHTASLFAGDAALTERTRWAAAALSPRGVRDRITLTAPSLNAARLKLLLACGESKAAALRQAVQEPASRTPLPIQLLDGLVVLADPGATGQLS
jgi:6-phosphogluconolactonase